MGTERTVICGSCTTRFTISEGGGFTFHQLHCDRCGEESTVGFAELGEVHRRYIAGLDVPYSFATQEWDRTVQATFEGEPLEEEAYLREVERFAGRCGCGGKFSFQALPRCPDCGSTSFEEDPAGEMLCFD